MANRMARTIAGACGGAAVLALVLSGVDGAGVQRTVADPSPTVAPTPSSPDDECCDPAQGQVQPQAQRSHLGCIIGLNCGQK
ncbi:hypothetical protein, partial [Mycobacterium sp.]|uniref:hypothetical protein n=1 Tax=Mycobacterium sp. TaxID=1785 RepID=UPI0025DC2812